MNCYQSLFNCASTKRRQLIFLKTRYWCEFSFIHINKTGGSSIEKALNAPLIHETALTFRSRIGERRWNERYSFAIVRNPWNRAVSQFHYRVMTRQTGLADNKMEFGDWLKRVFVERSPEYMNEEKMFLTQKDWITDEDGNVMVDYVGRFENLQQSWDSICTSLSREQSVLPHTKKSARGDYRQYYDNESREIIANFFQADIECFDYSFD